jgi:hypothetical protein
MTNAAEVRDVRTPRTYKEREDKFTQSFSQNIHLKVTSVDSGGGGE